MAEVDFSDLKAAEAWFEKQTPEMRCIMSSRAALRVLANIGPFYGIGNEGLVLASLRAALTSAGRGLGRHADVKVLERAGASAYLATRFAHEPVANSAGHSAAYSALSSARSAYSTRYAADSAAEAAADLGSSYSAGSAYSAACSATASDSTFSEQQLVTMAVWSGHPVPEPIFLAHGAFMQSLYNHADWAFWANWYRGMWDGTFRDWDLAIEVAKIPDEVWEGADAVAKVAAAILAIEARHELLREVSELRAELGKLRRVVSADAIGHNQGPPLDDAFEARVERQFELVWPILNDLDEEANKEVPDPNRLRVLAEALWGIATKIVSYCGGLIDVGLNKAAETLGEEGTKWTIRVLAAEAVASNSGVQSVAKAAWKFATALGG